MDKIQQLAATVALKKMLDNGYFCICTIDKILKMSGGIPSAKDYEILSTPHCVNFRDMPPELLRGLPVILQRVLNSEGITFTLKESNLKLIA